MPRLLALPLLVALSATVLLRAAEPSAAPAPAVAASAPEAAPSFAGKVVSLRIEGQIQPELLSAMSGQVEAAFKRIEAERPRLVVIEIHTPGGVVDTCDEISSRILRCGHELKIPTVALILRDAISGGAMIATACREIVMLNGSRIGDVQPMALGAVMDDRTAEKAEAYVRGVMASHAAANGTPARILEAMVSRTVGKPLYEIVFADGKREFLTEKELALLEAEIARGADKRSISGKKIVAEAGRLLVLTTGEALAWGLAKEVHASRDAFYASRSIAADDIVDAGVGPGGIDLSRLEAKLGFARWELALLCIFLAAALAGLVGELLHPGATLPAAISVTGFLCFFYLLVRHGSADWPEIAMVAAGVALLAVEIIVLPGFGIPGFLGAGLLLAGLFLAFVPDLDSAHMRAHWRDEVLDFFTVVSVAAVAAGVGVWLLLRFGKVVPVVRSIQDEGALPSGSENLARMHEEAVRETAEAAARNPVAALVGLAGKAETVLRPAGKLRLDRGDLLDVMAESGFIQEGRRCVVRSAVPGHIVVSPE